MLRSEIPSAMCAKLIVLIHGHIVLRAHPVRGEDNVTGEIATTFPPYYNEPH